MSFWLWNGSGKGYIEMSDNFYLGIHMGCAGWLYYLLKYMIFLKKIILNHYFNLKTQFNWFVLDMGAIILYNESNFLAEVNKIFHYIFSDEKRGNVERTQIYQVLYIRTKKNCLIITADSLFLKMWKCQSIIQNGSKNTNKNVYDVIHWHYFSVKYL